MNHAVAAANLVVAQAMVATTIKALEASSGKASMADLLTTTAAIHALAISYAIDSGMRDKEAIIEAGELCVRKVVDALSTRKTDA